MYNDFFSFARSTTFFIHRKVTASDRQIKNVLVVLSFSLCLVYPQSYHDSGIVNLCFPENVNFVQLHVIPPRYKTSVILILARRLSVLFLFLSLSLAGNVGGAFSIDSSGNITVAKKLDRETKNAYELTITAQDRAGTSISGSLLMSVISYRIKGSSNYVYLENCICYRSKNEADK